jgi:hypothetical protein
VSSEEVTLGRQAATPSASLGQMLKSQYSSREINDILAASEFREVEIVGMSACFGSRFITLIKSTATWQLEGLAENCEERKTIEERLAIKRLIESDPCALAYVLQDSYLFAFSLLRQSLKRQSRGEALRIASAPRPAGEGTTDVGLKDRLFSRLGVSKKYRTEFVRKE